jgi:histidinol-phosphate aminotransferase
MSENAQALNGQSSIRLRPDLVGLEPYNSFDVPIKIRLNTNENPYPLPDAVVNAITDVVEKTVKGTNRYPSDNYETLKQKLVNLIIEQEGDEGLTIDNITAGNGSNEVMFEIFQAFGGPNSTGALTFTPSYSMYPQYARDSFTKLHICPRVGKNFDLDKLAAIHEIEEQNPSLIIITNPNNPTGTWTPVETIEQILHFTQTCDDSGKRPIVVVDEAYVDFRDSELESALNLVNKYDNLIVVRTLSKAFSFAGVRFGYAIGSKLMIDSLKIVRLPYNLSTLTQNVVSEVVENHSDLMLKAVHEIRDTRNNLVLWLNGQPFSESLNVVDSQANFVQIGVFPFDDSVVGELHDFLLEHSVQIRVVGPVGYFRITIGTPDEIECFKELFKEFMYGRV